MEYFLVCAVLLRRKEEVQYIENSKLPQKNLYILIQKENVPTKNQGIL